MTIVKHELRQGRTGLAVWTASIGALLAVCVFLFPEIKGEMGAVGDLFASMGSFSDAFGMDRLNFGTFIGFYAIECGNVLGQGGAFFAALIGTAALAKEEKGRTAEFLLTHPVSRASVVAQKGIAVAVQITALNVLVFALSLASAACIGEDIPWRELSLLHLAYFLMQLEIGAVCFGISAFLRRGEVGVGLGLAVVLYFLNLIANMAERAEFLKYLTPFGYCDGADIVSSGRLELTMVLLWIGLGAGMLALGLWKYCKKDIH